MSDYVYISDHTYTTQQACHASRQALQAILYSIDSLNRWLLQILMMETMMLKTLNWEMCPPTPRVFADRFLRAAEADEQLACLTYVWPRVTLPHGELWLSRLTFNPGPWQYLIELTVVDITFLKYMASTIAASAVSMALFTLGRVPWSSTLSHYTQMDPWHIELCLHDLHKVHACRPGRWLYIICPYVCLFTASPRSCSCGPVSLHRRQCARSTSQTSTCASPT